MNPVPLVCVVVPAFNAALWIEETLASVAAQTVGPERLEVIVVDDGSTDDTAVVAERYLAASRLCGQVIRQANAGPSKARNTGWRAARADWIQCLDADDLIAPEKLAVQLAVAEADETAAIVYSPWAMFGQLEPPWETERPFVPRVGADVIGDYLDGDWMQVASVLYRRSWLEAIGGWDETQSHGEDHDLIFRTAFAGGRFATAPFKSPLFFYRRHGRSLSTTAGRQFPEAMLRNAVLIEERSRECGELSDRRRRAVATMYALGARGLAAFDPADAEPWIDRVLALDPHYRPDDSPRLRILSRLFGFRRAVRLAARINRWRGPRAVSDTVTVPPPLFATSNKPHQAQLGDRHENI